MGFHFHGQVAFGQAHHHVTGVVGLATELLEYAAGNDPAHHHGQHCGGNAKGHDQSLSRCHQLVGIFASLLHQLGLQVDQCINCLQIISLRFAQVTGQHGSKVSLLDVGLDHFNGLVLLCHVGCACSLDLLHEFPALFRGDDLVELLQALSNDLSLFGNGLQ